MVLPNLGPTCTIIVPIGWSTTNLAEIKTWIPFMDSSRIHIHLIHDIKDLTVSVLLQNLVEGLNRKNVTLSEGYFGSPGAARNIGLDSISTDWFCFWDSDDLVNTDAFLQVLEILDQNYDLVVSDYTLCRVGTKDQMVRINPNRVVTEIVLDPGIWRMIFRTDFFGECRFRDFKMGEDQVFLVESKVESARILHTNKAWYTYVKGQPNQLTSNQVHLSGFTETILFTARLASSIPGIKSKLIREFFAKQVLTKMKSGSIPSRVSGAAILIRTLGSTNPKNFYLLVSSFITIFFRLLFRKAREKYEI
jgi:glycosyltransferase involved in cell wall biosynthesis